MSIKTLKETILHKGWVTLKDMVFEVPSLKPDGAPVRLTREVVVTGDAATILIYAPECDSFLLTRECRAGVFCNGGGDNPYIWQCVAGKIEGSKSPLETACAELQEEAGIVCQPDDLTLITTVYASPASVTEKVNLYLACVPGTPETGYFGLAHEGEEIETALFPREDLYAMMDRGEIIDSMLFLALGWFRYQESTYRVAA